MTPFNTTVGPKGALCFEPDIVERAVAEQIYDRAAAGAYHEHVFRAVGAFWDRGMVPEHPSSMSSERLARVHALLDEAGWLEAGRSPGFVWAKVLMGSAIEFEGPAQEPLLLIAASGNQVSNDHYPYYEFLFRNEEPLTAQSLVSMRRFYFDIAGMERLHGGVLYVVCIVAATFVGISTALTVMTIRRLIEWRRLGQRGFPLELQPAPADVQ